MLTEALVLRDPDVPVIGNPKGDISIVEWYDYNCPYCRKVAPELRQVVEDDGKVRLVLKDWPILGEVSKLSARLTLAAKYQDKYLPAHGRHEIHPLHAILRDQPQRVLRVELDHACNAPARE